MTGDGQGGLQLDKLAVLTRRFRSADSLERQHYSRAKGAAIACLRQRIEAGHVATEAKELLGHGGYIAWLERECTRSRQTVGRWRKLAALGLTPEEIMDRGGQTAVLDPGKWNTVHHLDEPADSPPTVHTPVENPPDPETREAVVVAAETQWAGEKPRQKLHTGLRPEERPATRGAGGRGRGLPMAG